MKKLFFLVLIKAFFISSFLFADDAKDIADVECNGIYDQGCVVTKLPSELAEAKVSEKKEELLLFNLESLIELALKNNPQMEISEGEIEAAMANVDHARTFLLPTLRAQAGFTEYRRQQRLYPAGAMNEPMISSHHILGADLVATIPLYQGGRVRKSIEAASFEKEAAVFQGEWSEIELIFYIKKLYYSILAQRELINAFYVSEKAIAKRVEQIKALLAEQKASPLDLQRIEVRLAVLKQQRVKEETSFKNLTLTLLTFIAVDDAINDVAIVGDLNIPIVDDYNDTKELLQTALNSRSDYLSLQSTIQSIEKTINVSQREKYPELLIQGSYGIRWGLWPGNDPDGASTVADVGQIGLYLDVPIFDGLQASAKIRQQRARFNTTKAQLRRLKLQVRIEVEASILELHTAMERVDLLKAIIGQAAEAFRVETQMYSAGRSTISDLLSAQSDLLEAEASMAWALADVNIAAAALQRALGVKE